ncbi:MAG: Cytidylate kinase [Myxococcaceae bacterium]|nr:Cytidylate kinase [Myxococcaceae bacterium]
MSSRPSGQVVVALDGPAGAGKSTAARLLAERLEYVLVDTGALYRGVALAALDRGVAWDDGAALGALVDALALTFVRDSEGRQRLHIDGLDRSGEIRTPQISDGASRVSRHRQVRASLLGLQRRLGESGRVVLEGRDIGTVVFPDAEVKVFLTASDEARAQRRYDELTLAGHALQFETVLAEIRDRDKRDSERDIAPLKPAHDAILMDTSGITLEEVVAQLEAIVRSRC